MIIQRIWASLIGIVSTTIGILKFLSVVFIPTTDALIHIITGIIFLGSAWIFKGKYAGKINMLLGIFYMLFGEVGYNWQHIIVGVISLAIGWVSISTRVSPQ